MAVPERLNISIVVVFVRCRKVCSYGDLLESS